MLKKLLKKISDVWVFCTLRAETLKIAMVVVFGLIIAIVLFGAQ